MPRPFITQRLCKKSNQILLCVTKAPLSCCRCATLSGGVFKEGRHQPKISAKISSSNQLKCSDRMCSMTSTSSSLLLLILRWFGLNPIFTFAHWQDLWCSLQLEVLAIDSSHYCSDLYQMVLNLTPEIFIDISFVKSARLN